MSTVDDSHFRPVLSHTYFYYSPNLPYTHLLTITVDVVGSCDKPEMNTYILNNKELRFRLEETEYGDLDLGHL